MRSLCLSHNGRCVLRRVCVCVCVGFVSFCEICDASHPFCYKYLFGSPKCLLMLDYGYGLVYAFICFSFPFHSQVVVIEHICLLFCLYFAFAIQESNGGSVFMFRQYLFWIFFRILHIALHLLFTPDLVCSSSPSCRSINCFTFNYSWLHPSLQHEWFVSISWPDLA